MEDNINSKLSDLLSSPDLISNLQSALSSLSSTTKISEVLPAKSKNEIEALNLFQSLGSSNILDVLKNILGENQNERIALLTALRPFLSSEKQETLDLIIQILKAVNIFLAANVLSQ